LVWVYEYSTPTGGVSDGNAGAANMMSMRDESASVTLMNPISAGRFCTKEATRNYEHPDE
jgi:hypothetical protein